MIKHISLPAGLQTSLYIILTRNDLSQDTIQSSIVVNSFDPVSVIYDEIGKSVNQINLIYKQQVLCSALSFSFYSIKNNDTIYIVEKSSNIKDDQIKIGFNFKQTFNKKESIERFINKKLKEKDSDPNCLQRFQDSLSSLTNRESARLTDVYRFKIESLRKPYRKLCNKFNTLVNSDNKTVLKVVSNFKTVLPEKSSFPSTSYLPNLILKNKL